MVVLMLIELLMISLFIAFGVTQVFIPLIEGEPLFPIFRKRRRLEGKLISVHEEIRETELEADIVEASQIKHELNAELKERTKSDVN